MKPSVHMIKFDRLMENINRRLEDIKEPQVQQSRTAMGEYILDPPLSSLGIFLSSFHSF
jgi:hypothetical protein